MAENKYAVDCKGRSIDVYDVLNAFGVTCPAAQHAIKKLLMPGKRGHKSELGDLLEARASVDRAIDLARERHAVEDAKECFARASQLRDRASRWSNHPTLCNRVPGVMAELAQVEAQAKNLFATGRWQDEIEMTDRQLRDALVKNTPDDGQGEPPNASPKASLCRECGGTKIDGVCQEKGCGYEAG